MATTRDRAPGPAPGAAGGVAAAHRALALLFVLAGAVQFLLAGYSAFGGGDWDPHRVLGSVLGAVALLVLLLALAGRRAALQPSAILFGLMVVQTALGTLGEDAPVLGALHPLVGLVLLGVGMSAAAGRPFGPPHGGPARA